MMATPPISPHLHWWPAIFVWCVFSTHPLSNVCLPHNGSGSQRKSFRERNKSTGHAKKEYLESRAISQMDKRNEREHAFLFAVARRIYIFYRNHVDQTQIWLKLVAGRNYFFYHHPRQANAEATAAWILFRPLVFQRDRFPSSPLQAILFWGHARVYVCSLKTGWRGSLPAIFCSSTTGER